MSNKKFIKNQCRAAAAHHPSSSFITAPASTAPVTVSSRTWRRPDALQPVLVQLATAQPATTEQHQTRPAGPRAGLQVRSQDRGAQPADRRVQQARAARVWRPARARDPHAKDFHLLHARWGRACFWHNACIWKGKSAFARFSVVCFVFVVALRSAVSCGWVCFAASNTLNSCLHTAILMLYFAWDVKSGHLLAVKKQLSQKWIFLSLFILIIFIIIYFSFFSGKQKEMHNLQASLLSVLFSESGRSAVAVELQKEHKCTFEGRTLNILNCYSLKSFSLNDM